MDTPGTQDGSAELLARVIETTREQAIAAGVRPVPATTYRGLLDYFPRAVLQRVRYASGFRPKGIRLPPPARAYAEAPAMTVGDVVLFREEAVARTDLRLWALALTHVMQFQRWGIEGFAARYLSDRTAVEREARETADRFLVWQADGRKVRALS